MLLINCEINLILTWSANCIIKSSALNQATTFAITDIKLYVLEVTSSAEDNAKLYQQLKFGCKGTINCSKYQSKATTQVQKYI